jgi:hypothetical protein
LQRLWRRARVVVVATTGCGHSRDAPMATRAAAPAAAGREIFSPGLLTVEKTVIRFRPTAETCGRE